MRRHNKTIEKMTFVLFLLQIIIFTIFLQISKIKF